MLFPKKIQEARRGSSHTLHSSSITPNWKTCILQLQQEDVFYFTIPAEGKKIFSLSGNSSANEMVSQLSQWKATTCWTPSFLQWTFCNSPPQIPPFLSKITFPSFVLQTFLRVHHSFHILNCNSLSFLNKLIFFFAGKITVLLFRPIPTNGRWYMILGVDMKLSQESKRDSADLVA